MVLTLHMCMCRGPVVLRKALDQFVLTGKNNMLLKENAVKTPEFLHVPDNHFESQKRSLVEQRQRVIKDKVPKNTTWLVLDHPLFRMSRVSEAAGGMFGYLFKALLDHAWGETEPPAIRISGRKAVPYVVTRFQRSTILVFFFIWF